jgi:hypothetical protein
MPARAYACHPNACLPNVCQPKACKGKYLPAKCLQGLMPVSQMLVYQMPARANAFKG